MYIIIPIKRRIFVAAPRNIKKFGTASLYRDFIFIIFTSYHYRCDILQSLSLRGSLRSTDKNQWRIFAYLRIQGTSSIGRHFSHETPPTRIEAYKTLNFPTFIAIP